MCKLFLIAIFVLYVMTHSVIAWRCLEDTEPVPFRDVERKVLLKKCSFKNIFFNNFLPRNMWINLKKTKMDTPDRNILSFENERMICNRGNYITAVKVIKMNKITTEKDISFSIVTLVGLYNNGNEEFFGQFRLSTVNDDNLNIPFNLDFTNFHGYLVCLVKGKEPQLIPKDFEKEIFTPGPWTVPVKVTIRSNPLMPFGIQPVITIFGNSNVLASGRDSFLWPYGMKYATDAFLMIQAEEGFKHGMNCFLTKKDDKSDIKLQCNYWKNNEFLSNFNNVMIPLGILIYIMDAMCWKLPDKDAVMYQYEALEGPNFDRLMNIDEKPKEVDPTNQPNIKWIKRIVEKPSERNPNESIFQHGPFTENEIARDILSKTISNVWLASLVTINGIKNFIRFGKLFNNTKKMKKVISNAPFVFPWKLERPEYEESEIEASETTKQNDN